MSEQFKPTEEQRKRAKKLLDDGFGIDKARLFIKHLDGTYKDKPISKDTFSKVFHEEIETAEMDTLELCIDKIKQRIHNDDFEAIRFYVSTHGKGYFRKKLEIDTTTSLKDQLNQVLEAAADGRISPIECDSLVNALKAKIDSVIEECKARLDTLENVSSKRD